MESKSICKLYKMTVNQVFNKQKVIITLYYSDI